MFTFTFTRNTHPQVLYVMAFFSYAASQGVEEIISAVDNAALGDKGNPQVKKDLDALGKAPN